MGAEKFHHNVLAFKDIPESISMFEALLIYLFEKSILDSIAIVLMMYLFGVMAWGTSESNFNFALPVTHVLLDELHYRMTLGTQFTGFFKMSLAWLTCIAVLRLAPLFRGQKKYALHNEQSGSGSCERHQCFLGFALYGFQFSRLSGILFSL